MCSVFYSIVYIILNELVDNAVKDCVVLDL